MISAKATNSGRRSAKKSPILAMFGVILICGLSCVPTNAQSNEWAWMSGSITTDGSGIYGELGTPAPGNSPGARSRAATWTDRNGNLWLFGGDGFDSAGNPGSYPNDLWEFSPSKREWALIGGNATVPISGVGNGIYGTQGTASTKNIPPGREAAISWTDAQGNLWLFGGFNYSRNNGTSDEFNDLWMFNPSTNEWTWVGGSSSGLQSGNYGQLGRSAPGNMPGSRNSAVSWTDPTGNLWLFGGAGYDSSGNQGDLNDLWRFNPSTKLWTWMSGANTVGQVGIYGTQRVASAANMPGARNHGIGWSDSSGNLWIFSGGGMPNDLWKYNTTTNQWTWMSGENSGSFQAGVYGSLQIPSANSVPGTREGAVAWTDSKGHLWLFGGQGPDSTDTEGALNDLWEFDPSLNEWSWMGGSSAVPAACQAIVYWCGQFSVFGTIQTPALGNVPGGRYDLAGWNDGKGGFWLFGGIGFDFRGFPGYLNDLWEFQPNTNGLLTASAPIFSPGSGAYSSWQSVTIDDSIPGAIITYLINGNPPALTYSAPITISSSQTIEAIASSPGYANSNISTATYVADMPIASTPTFSVASGTYASTQSVAVIDTIPGANIYYAIGTLPTANFSIYSGPITVAATEIVQAMAVAPGYINSPVVTASYNIGSSKQANWTWVGGSGDLPVCPSPGTCGQAGWYGTLKTPSAGNFPGGRWNGLGWTDNNGRLWLFGGLGYDAAGGQGYLNDLWQFDPSASEWTWMGGASTVRCYSGAGCGQPGVYGTLGAPSSTNTPGGRSRPSYWTDAKGDLWVFGGWGFDSGGNVGYLNDLWRFDPSTDEWTWIGGTDSLACPNCGQPGHYGDFGKFEAGNIPGGRTAAAGWIDKNGNLWLYGGSGYDALGLQCGLDDLWEYSPSAAQWAWQGGSEFCLSEGGVPGVYGTLGVPAVGNIPWDLQAPSAWTDLNGNLWLFGGLGIDLNKISYYFNDMWAFNPPAGEWAWTSEKSGGAALTGTIGEFGLLNIPGPRSEAGSWTDKDGNFWLFGGNGAQATGFGILNDLWGFKPSINEWAWMGGSSTNFNQPGTYGAIGSSASTNVPGARYDPTTWTDQNGNLWMFGGKGFDAQGTQGYLNDLWQYGLKGTPALRPAATGTPLFSLAAGTYNAPQTLTITDQTSDATIYYTMNGTVPNSGSPVYSGPITISSSGVVQAIAVASGYSVSDTASAVYTINLPQTAAPTFSLPSGTYDGPQSISISDSAAGAAIYYTIDGTAPTTKSTIYAGPIKVSSSETIEAIALAPGYSQSIVGTVNYSIILPPPSFTISGTPAIVTKGGTSTSSITIQSVAGFSGTVTLAAVLADYPKGALYPPTFSFGATSPVSLTGSTASAALTITTTAATNADLRPHPKLWQTSEGPLLACGLLFLISFNRRRRLMLGALCIALTCSLGISGCGGGTGNGSGGVGGRNTGTTPGSYTITVTGTSGVLTETTSVALTVQ
jgi:N-acetylneuraminic acid mutarotase